MNRKKKKAQVPIEPLLEILALLVFVVIIIWLTVFTERETVRINIEEAEIIKAKATADIVKLSLDNTWFISTIQVVFRAGTMEEYWFYTDPNMQKTIPPPLPAGRICTNTNPRVCYPEDAAVESYMKMLIGSIYFNITKEFELNDAETKIGELEIKKISLEEFGVRSVISDKIRTESGFTSILTENEHENFIFTRLKTMFEAGRAVVQLARLIATDPSLLFYEQNQNHEEYKQRATFILQGGYNQIVQPYSGIYSRLTLNTLVYVANPFTGTGLLNNQGGLILTYDLDAKFSDQFGGVTSRTCNDVHDYDNAIELIVLSHAERDGGEWVWKFGDKKYPVQQITAMVKGIINQESGWAPGAISSCGAAGMMQLMPDTARGQGLSVPAYSTTVGACDCGTVAVAECNSCNGLSSCNLQTDQRFDAIQNIRGGVSYVNFLFDYFENRGENEENLMKLVTAAYNGGQGTVDNAIEEADSKKYEDIAPYLHEQTRSYVPSVLGCYPFYLGSSGTQNNNVASYLWPTISRTVTSCMNSDHPLGIDVGGSYGESIKAVDAGEVIKFKNDCGTDRSCGGCDAGAVGNCVLIKHDDDRYSLYGHLKEVDENIEEGTEIRRGQPIGKMGNTGYVTDLNNNVCSEDSTTCGVHLHFEIRDSSGVRVDPCQFIDCGQSTYLQCTPGAIGFGPGGIEAGEYYYHDEAANKFVKRPISLEFKVKDHIPILACAYNSNKRYEWDTVNDLLCYDNDIWSCTRTIPGLDAEHKKNDHQFAGSGDIWQCVESPTISPRFCLKGFDTSTNEECCRLWLPSENGVLCRQQEFCSGDGTINSNEAGNCLSPDVIGNRNPDSYCQNTLDPSGQGSGCCSWQAVDNNGDGVTDDYICTRYNKAKCSGSNVCLGASCKLESDIGQCTVTPKPSTECSCQWTVIPGTCNMLGCPGTSIEEFRCSIPGCNPQEGASRCGTVCAP